MIVDLPDTTISEVSKTLVRIREEGGVVALGRVLTLIISTEFGQEEEAIEAANDASREHPMRVIAVLKEPADAAVTENRARLDAQIRVGGDAGASEVVILRAYGEVARDEEGLVTGLLLPDAPVVTWWPGTAPDVAATSALGRIATRRITDAATADDPHAALRHLGQTYSPGDTDFAWTRLTLWRAQLAAVLDQPPYTPVRAVEVAGALTSPSTVLLAAWLGMELDVPVQHDLARGAGAVGIRGVRLERENGTVALEREVPNIATLAQPGQPVQDLALPRRGLRECLAEELRRLDPDDLFGEVITRGLERLARTEYGTGARLR